MSHLGRRLSALIDGELGDSERDQVHAHMVSCDACREEAASLRLLKRRIGGLGETPADSDLTRRLIALGGLPDPAVPPSRARSAMAAFSGVGPATGPSPWDAPGSWLDGSPAEGEPSLLAPSGTTSASRGRGHARFMVAGAVAAIAVSLGTASFAAGGDHSTGPVVNPDVELYSAEQAVTTGQMPTFTQDAYLAPRPAGVRTNP
jgi:anti-sigma factor RsiW